jgi:lantibiotic modifying enzyme
MVWVTEQPTNASLANGFAGLMWVIQHFIRIGLLEDEAGQFLTDLDQHLQVSLEADYINRNYDLLHGLVGKGLYLLERLPHPASAEVLKKLVDQLESLAVEGADILTWQDPSASSVNTYNLGMAHGVPSIISFLAKVHRSGVTPKQTHVLLTKATSWLLQQEKPVGYSRFPLAAGMEVQSRLGWCYGDLGPALALFHAAQALGRNDWRTQALDVARYASQRTIENGNLSRHTLHGWLDTGFCHGTAGIAHIFNSFYQVSRSKEFKNSAQYWLKLSLPPLPADEGIAGYVQLSFDAERKSKPCLENTALLGGATGVGLVLLSFLQPQQPAWDGFFMTDIYS